MRKLNLLQKKQMAIEELIKYENELRKYNYNKGSELEAINIRKKIHWLVNLILKIDQVLSKEKIIVLNDKHNTQSNNSRIYACTHIGGNDIQRTFQVIKEPAYLMLGDPGILYKMLIYQGLRMNGVIPLDTMDREDRKIAYNRSIELLNKGGNLLIYPEGAWNVSPNLVVMKIFKGAIRMAKETGAEIIPIGVEQYDDTFYFNIGENYTISKDTLKSEDELRDELREKLATLKWEIIESQPKFDRADLTDNYLEDFQNKIVERCNYGYGFSLQDALAESFHDKTITDEEEVYSFLDDLEIGTHNAFLLQNKLNLKRIKKNNNNE